jgi:hydroxymethylbilane synthase
VRFEIEPFRVNYIEEVEHIRMRIRVGTRKSPLALRQTELVVESIRSRLPELEFEVVPIVTQGDRVLSRPLGEFGGKGVFVEEFEGAILRGEIDLAVHSAKDIPNALHEGLSVVYIPPRADHRDVLVTTKGVQYSPSDTFTVGTGSIRREYQLTTLYPNAVFKGIRGNIHTRLGKLLSGEYDAIVLASAGLERMGITEEEYTYRYFTDEECLCAGCQGIIAVEGIANSPLAELLTPIEDIPSRVAFEVERGVLGVLDVGCHECSGVYASISGDTNTINTIRAEVLLPNRTRKAFTSHSVEALLSAVKEYYYHE